MASADCCFHLQLYPEFYCLYEDPSYLKRLKIDVLIAIADQTNAYEIAEEMTQASSLGGCSLGSCWALLCRACAYRASANSSAACGLVLQGENTQRWHSLSGRGGGVDAVFLSCCST